ncbi:hypothetical protein ACS49_02565 [Bacillus cereus]|nr:hypothetical protein ACS49_02565 [Bacillus cereus]
MERQGWVVLGQVFHPCSLKVSLTKRKARLNVGPFTTKKPVTKTPSTHKGPKHHVAGSKTEHSRVSASIKTTPTDDWRT